MSFKCAAQRWNETPHWVMIDPYMCMEADIAYQYAAYPNPGVSRLRIAALPAGDAAHTGLTH